MFLCSLCLIHRIECNYLHLSHCLCCHIWLSRFVGLSIISVGIYRQRSAVRAIDGSFLSYVAAAALSGDCSVFGKGSFGYLAGVAVGVGGNVKSISYTIFITTFRNFNIIDSTSWQLHFVTGCLIISVVIKTCLLFE